MRITYPIEVKSRDFKPGVWLATQFLEQDHEVVLGETASIRDGMDVIKPDIYFRHGLSRSEKRERLARELDKCNVSIFALNTEGGVQASDEDFYNLYKDNGYFDYVDGYFTWGKRQAEILSEVTDFPQSQLFVTGHYRFDLLQEEFRSIYSTEAEEHVDSFGNYILINTNFTYINHSSKTPEKFPKHVVEHQRRLFQRYLELITNTNQDFPDHSVIIRPHPIENESAYEDFAADMEDVFVIKEGIVRPWILGSDLVVHKSSTTGIESALLDIPVISYRPYELPERDAPVPIAVSDEVKTYPEFRTAATSYIQGQEYSLDSNQVDILKEYFHNIHGTKAIDEIVSTIEEHSSDGRVDFVTFPSAPITQQIKRLGTKYLGIEWVERINEVVRDADYSGVRTKIDEISEANIRNELKCFSEFTAVETEDIVIRPIPELPNTYILQTP